MSWFHLGTHESVPRGSEPRRRGSNAKPRRGESLGVLGQEAGAGEGGWIEGRDHMREEGGS